MESGILRSSVATSNFPWNLSQENLKMTNNLEFHWQNESQFPWRKKEKSKERPKESKKKKNAKQRFLPFMTNSFFTLCSYLFHFRRKCFFFLLFPRRFNEIINYISIQWRMYDNGWRAKEGQNMGLAKMWQPDITRRPATVGENRNWVRSAISFV